MNPVSKTHIKIIAAFVATTALVAGVFYLKHSKASIDSLTVAPSTLATDDVAGKTDAHYTVSYTSGSFDPSSNLSQITVTFPDGYAITDGSFDPAAAIDSSSENGCSASLGYVCFKGDDSSIQVTSMAGDSSARTITISFNSFSLNTVVSPYDIAFTILEGIQNPTLSGVKDAAGFSVDDNATGNDPTAPGSDITIVADVATHLVFTQEPSGPSSNGMDSISGAAFDVQPIVAAEDQYGNVDTNYDSHVQLAVATGAGSVAEAAGVSLGSIAQVGALSGVSAGAGVGASLSCTSTPNAYDIAAVAGIADFSTDPIAYYASVDHESFSLAATGFCSDILPEVDSNVMTSDVVADSLFWTTAPDGCTSSAACTTQGVIEAQGLGTSSGGGLTRLSLGSSTGEITDIDFSGDISLGLTGAGTIVGTNPQTMTAGVLTTVGLGYTSVDPTVDSSTDFTADSGRLTQGVSSFLSGMSIPVYASPVSMAVVSPVSPSSPSPTPSSPTPTPTSRSESIGAGRPRSTQTIATAVSTAMPIATVATLPTTTHPTTTPLTPTSSRVTTGSNTGSNGCSPYLTQFLRLGDTGNEVKKLQRFLQAEGSYAEGFVTGFFGSLTENAVKKFQAKYVSDILTPQALPVSTGYAKDYTQSKINGLVCDGVVKL